MNPASDPSCIARVLTPLGTGAIAVITLTGPEAGSILQKVFEPHGPKRSAPPRDQLVLGRLRDRLGDIDDALAVATRSGPTWHIEINTHGSWRVVQRLMTRLAELGVETLAGDTVTPSGASVGEDLLERDWHDALAKCRTSHAVHFVSAATVSLREWLDGLADKPDASDPQTVRAQLQEALARYELDKVLIEGVRVVLLGPPNTGKSTLANRFYARRASLESPVPGTTRDWVEEPAVLGGVPVSLVDTAGLRRTEEAREAEAIRRGLDRSECADFLWFVTDYRASLPDDALEWLGAHRGNPRALLLLNKIDKPAKTAAARTAPPEWKDRTVRISARTGRGIEDLEGAFVAQLGLHPINKSLPNLICQRQAELVRFALARQASDGPEFSRRLAADLRSLPGIRSG